MNDSDPNLVSQRGKRRYALRAILIGGTALTLLGLIVSWLASESSIAGERRAMAARIEQLGGRVETYAWYGNPRVDYACQMRCAVFDDLPVFWIILPKQQFSAAEAAHVRSLFPTAQIDHVTVEAGWKQFSRGGKKFR